jgi:uncharacterized protein (DUF488 family)
VTAVARIWTIGHSTRPLEEFLELLAQHELEAVADVRRFPGSRRNPQYAGTALAESLVARSLEYRWIPALGGRREPKPDSANTNWRNASFRGYADYMETPAFAAGMEELRELASRRRTAILCAELLWWRCHRSLISDLLQSEGTEVVHIRDAGDASLHTYTKPARVVDGRLTYAPAGAQEQLGIFPEDG